ncbi:MAG: TraR/DksA C4-type zinc finger protein [Bacillota bacterium]
MNRSQMEHFRHLLEEERRRYLNMEDGLRARGMGTAQTDSVGELSSYDNHPADLGSETFERQKDLGLMGHAQMILDQIDQALARLDEGTYGWCEACGNPIEPERLEAVPYATRCAACKREEEALPDTNDRPAEEDVMMPPFGRSFRDETGEPGFDGEDTWEAVAHYGTSETPQDEPGSRNYEELGSDEAVDSGTVELAERLVDNQGEVLFEQVRRTDEWERL